MKTGIELIAEERQRQINEEGFSLEHDMNRINGELANAAAYYAFTDELINVISSKDLGKQLIMFIWPFELEWLKRTPNNRIRDLQKAGALIAAEIDRLILVNKKLFEEIENNSESLINLEKKQL